MDNCKLWFCVFLFSIHSLYVFLVKGCQNQPLFQILTSCGRNKALNGFTFLNFNTTMKINCSRTCAQHNNCTSFNIGSVNDGMFTCELNSHYWTPHCSDLVSREHFKFYLRKVTYLKTCKDIKNKDAASKTGVYWIQPKARGEPFKVYCDMDTDGGGWTLVYSYRFTDVGIIPSARLSVWPTWNMDADTPKSTVAPLSDLEEGAMEFDLWRTIGEEFLITSTETNWYQCAPSVSSYSPGSLTEFTPGDLECSAVKVQIPGTGCDQVAPKDLQFYFTGVPYLGNGRIYDIFILYDGFSSQKYPTHDPCGTNSFGSEASRSLDTRGAIYVK